MLLCYIYVIYCIMGFVTLAFMQDKLHVTEITLK